MLIKFGVIWLWWIIVWLPLSKVGLGNLKRNKSVWSWLLVASITNHNIPFSAVCAASTTLQALSRSQSQTLYSSKSPLLSETRLVEIKYWIGWVLNNIPSFFFYDIILTTGPGTKNIYKTNFWLTPIFKHKSSYLFFSLS